MTCAICCKFPESGQKEDFIEVALSEQRHAFLFSCRHCGQHFELSAESRSVNFLSDDQLKLLWSIGR